MRTFVATYTTDYGLSVAVINAFSEEAAQIIADDIAQAWKHTLKVQEIDRQAPGRVFIEISKKKKKENP